MRVRSNVRRNVFWSCLENCFGNAWVRFFFHVCILLSVLKLLVSLFALLKKYVNILKPYGISGKNLELRR